MKKVAVVTGANRGIGNALAEILLSEKYAVVNASKTKPTDDSGSIFIRTDLRKKEECGKMISTVVSKFGRIDLLINNAGVLYPDSTENLDPKLMKLNFETNVFGSFYMSYFASRQMKKQKSGTIVNISSSAGVSFRKNIASYLSSKWAITGFSGSLRLELEKYGIDVICFCPGGTKTSLFRNYKDDVARDFMDPKEVAGKILEALKRKDREKWLFVYLRKDRILKRYGFGDCLPLENY